MSHVNHFQGKAAVDPKLERLIEKARETEVDEAILREQRISFAYGNAPASLNITKASVRRAARSIRLFGPGEGGC